jgi:hypothetical protein
MTFSGKSARASFVTDTLHQVSGEDSELLRMAVLLQRAVLVAATVANTMAFATSKRGEINQ